MMTLPAIYCAAGTERGKRNVRWYTKWLQGTRKYLHWGEITKGATAYAKAKHLVMGRVEAVYV